MKAVLQAIGYLSLCLFLIPLKAQKISEGQQKRIDANFGTWDTETTPGISMAILSGDEVLLKSYGLADLTCGKPIEESTQFRFAGMAPHFIAYAVLLLEDQQRLNLDDDIRTYLPALPKYNKRITINHLLTHSSGLPAYWPLKSLAGFQAADLFTAEDMKVLYSHPWELQHEPGEKFVFSMTGPSLLAKIVAKVSGQSFSNFARDHIFAPLGMEHSTFLDAQAKGVDNLATPYLAADNGYQATMVNHLDPGVACFVSTPADLVKWYQNLKKPLVGSPALLAKLDRVATLADGTEARSPDGKMTYGQQFDHIEQGLVSIWEYGALGGFASSIFRFPEPDVTIIVASNAGLDYNGFLGMQTAEILLEDVFETPAEEPVSYVEPSEQMVEGLVGDYINTTYYNHRQIIYRNDSLRYLIPEYEVERPLLPIAKDVLQIVAPYGNYSMDIIKDEGLVSFDLQVEFNTFSYQKFEKAAYTSIQLEAFVGTYFSDRLQQSMEVTLEAGVLWIQHQHLGTIRLNIFQKDQFLASQTVFRLVSFQRNAANQCSGFELSGMGLKGIRYRKI